MPDDFRQSDPLAERIASMRTFSRAVQISLVVLCVVVSAGLYAFAANDLRGGLELQGASYSELVLATRAWNAGHGAVFVPKSASVTTNLYLRDLGIEPDVETTSGIALTMRNPSVMTREISERIARSQGVRFRLAALDPINPRNAADAWERESIEKFEIDKDPATTVEPVDGTTYFRYMVPLITDESCLACHARQGYKVGDVRGGLDVLVPYAATQAALARNAWLLAGLAVVSSAVLVGAFGVQFGRYQHGLEDAGTRLTRVATLDYLTGIPNRRTGIGRLHAEIDRSRRSAEPLSVIAVDIDNFKRINDQAGHAVGDDVLRGVVERMSTAIRDYDTLARIGGEEFLIIAPNTDSAEALLLANRIVAAVRHGRVKTRNQWFDVTISAGVALLDTADDTDRLLDRADRALYAAKEAGRDRAMSC